MSAAGTPSAPEPLSDGFEAASEAVRPSRDPSAADTLRRAADVLSPIPGHDSVAAGWDEVEGAVVCRPRPALAEALAAWLRVEADSAQVAQDYLDTYHGGVAPPGTWTTEYRHRHALALACLLLGETT